MKSSHPPIAKIGAVIYVDTGSNKIVETVYMREFLEWNEKAERYESVRLYELSRELELNPEFYRRERGID